MSDALLIAEIAALKSRAEALEKERDSYKKAKQENDERFQLERDEARKERDELRAKLDRARADKSDLVSGWVARAEKAEAALAASQERVRELDERARCVVTRHLAGDGFLLVGAINRLAAALSKPEAT